MEMTYCIRSEKRRSALCQWVGIFIYISSTLPDRKKANPGFTNSPFKYCCVIELATFLHYTTIVMLLSLIPTLDNIFWFGQTPIRKLVIE